MRGKQMTFPRTKGTNREHLTPLQVVSVICAASLASAGRVIFPDELDKSSSHQEGFHRSDSFSEAQLAHVGDTSSLEHNDIYDAGDHHGLYGGIGDYDDDKHVPGLFAPAIAKPFERARTLTGKYYMPELAYERPRYTDKSASLKTSSFDDNRPITVSGALIPVGVPVSLGGYSASHEY